MPLARPKKCHFKKLHFGQIFLFHITKLEIRTGTKDDKPTRTSAKTKGVSCSCGQLCKNFRGLKLHQIKAKCQASGNKLTNPDKRCFVSLNKILNTLFLKFGDTIYCKTPSKTFVLICNFDKPISATQCYRCTIYSMCY